MNKREFSQGLHARVLEEIRRLGIPEPIVHGGSKRDSTRVYEWPHEEGSRLLYFDITSEWVRPNFEIRRPGPVEWLFGDPGSGARDWTASYSLAKLVIEAAQNPRRNRDVLTRVHWRMSGRRNMLDVMTDEQGKLFIEHAVPDIIRFLAKVLDERGLAHPGR